MQRQFQRVETRARANSPCEREVMLKTLDERPLCKRLAGLVAALVLAALALGTAYAGYDRRPIAIDHTALPRADAETLVPSAAWIVRSRVAAAPRLRRGYSAERRRRGTWKLGRDRRTPRHVENSV